MEIMASLEKVEARGGMATNLLCYGGTLAVIYNMYCPVE